MRLLLMLALVACADIHSNQHVQFSSLSFELPDTWIETSSRNADSRMWVPSDNARHESIVLIRTNIPAGVSPDAVSVLLEDAQEGLTSPRPQATVAITTAGLRGARVEFDYLPPGFRVPYHRVHTVFLDGTSFVHVLYTAKTSDPELSTLGSVLRTLHET